MTRRLVDADEVLRKALATLAVLGVPPCRREAVVRVELPIRGLCKLEAIFDGIFHKAVEAPGRRRWLAPDEVFAEQESLIAEPEHQINAVVRDLSKHVEAVPDDRDPKSRREVAFTS